jgi:hypothetical protein
VKPQISRLAVLLRARHPIGPRSPNCAQYAVRHSGLPVTPSESAGSACSYPPAVYAFLSGVFRAQLAHRHQRPAAIIGSAPVSDGDTTSLVSAKCHAARSNFLRLSFGSSRWGRARSWLRRVASCRSKCSRWVDMSSSRTPTCLDTKPRALAAATRVSSVSLALAFHGLCPLSTRRAGSAAL